MAGSAFGGGNLFVREAVQQVAQVMRGAVVAFALVVLDFQQQADGFAFKLDGEQMPVCERFDAFLVRRGFRFA